VLLYSYQSCTGRKLVTAKHVYYQIGELKVWITLEETDIKYIAKSPPPSTLSSLIFLLGKTTSAQSRPPTKKPTVSNRYGSLRSQQVMGMHNRLSQHACKRHSIIKRIITKIHITNPHIILTVALLHQKIKSKQLITLDRCITLIEWCSMMECKKILSSLLLLLKP